MLAQINSSAPGSGNFIRALTRVDDRDAQAFNQVGLLAQVRDYFIEIELDRRLVNIDTSGLNDMTVPWSLEEPTFLTVALFLSYRSTPACSSRRRGAPRPCSRSRAR